MADIKDVLENLTDMPALPTVVAKLTRLISDPKTTASQINDALSQDPGLVAKILRLVNSSYYGFPRRITTITNAVVILGFNQVRNLALSAFIFDKFAKMEKGSPFDVKGFWKHCIGAAFLSARFARILEPRLEEDAFICGLLHDLGKFVMSQHAGQHLTLVIDLVKKNDILFHEAEKRCLNYDHAQLGAAVMERWNLPEMLVEVVKNHHAPLTAPDKARHLAAIVNVSDIVTRAMLMGTGGDNKIPLLAPEVWSALGLDWKVVDGVMRAVAEEYSKSDAFFSIG